MIINEFAISKRLNVAVAYNSSIPPWIVTDEIRLNNIIVELLISSLKNTNKGELNLIVQVKDKNEKTWLKFKISGPNFDITNVCTNSTIEAALETNERTNPPCINIFLSKPLIDVFDGKLKIMAKPEKPSYISFKVPVEIYDENSLPMNEESEIPEESKCDCARFLILDSNPLNTYVLNSYIERLKIKCKFAQDSAAAFTLIQHQSIQRCCQHFSLIFINLGHDEECFHVFSTSYLDG